MCGVCQLFIIGDKGRAQLARPFPEFITQISSDSLAPYNFTLVRTNSRHDRGLIHTRR